MRHRLARLRPFELKKIYLKNDLFRVSGKLLRVALVRVQGCGSSIVLSKKKEKRIRT